MSKIKRAVGAVIRNKSGELLVLYHNKMNGLSIPVGKCLDDESYVDALVREMKEELLIIPTKYSILTRSTRKVDGVMYMTIIFTIENYYGEITNAEPEKHATLEYMSLDNLLAVPVGNSTGAALLTLTGKTAILVPRSEKECNS